MAHNAAYRDIRDYLDTMAVIDTHEHYFETTETRPIEVLALLANPFYTNDVLRSVSPDAAQALGSVPLNADTQFGAFYDIFERLYAKCRHTSYMRAAVRGLEECWGLTRVDRPSLAALQERMSERGESFYNAMMEKHKIRAKILDTCSPERLSELASTGGIKGFSPYCRFAFPLSSFYNFSEDGDAVPQMLERLSGQKITTLDTYLDAFDSFVGDCFRAGAVCFKDAQAYRRIIRYDKTDKSVAEELFARVLEGERLKYNDFVTLGNYFVREAMPIAAKYDIPIQIHTGLLAGLHGEISRTNAVHLTELIADFPKVRFDLFHGSWPYMGEYLFLAKNYPNVTLDLCWAQSIDCDYSIELMRRAIMTVPQNKLMAFGGDCGSIESNIGFLCQAKDNAAAALSSLMDDGWLSAADAREIARDWFFNNPNELFGLGFDREDS